MVYRFELSVYIQDFMKSEMMLASDKAKDETKIILIALLGFIDDNNLDIKKINELKDYHIKAIEKDVKFIKSAKKECDDFSVENVLKRFFEMLKKENYFE